MLGEMIDMSAVGDRIYQELTTEIIQPVQYFGMLRQIDKADRIRYLMSRVMEESFKNLFSKDQSPSRIKRKLDAWDWFQDTEDSSLFSCSTICTQLDLSQSWVLGNLQKLKSLGGFMIPSEEKRLQLERQYLAKVSKNRKSRARLN